MGEPVAKKSKKTNALREAVRALAMAALSPKSPASDVVSDRYVLEQIARYAKPAAGRMLASVYGGRQAAVYATDDGTWSRGQDMPDGRTAFGAAVAGDGRIFIIGGRAADDGSTMASVFATSDPVDGKWEPMPPLPHARQSLCACTVGDTIYAIGGYNSVFGTVNTCETFSTMSGGGRWVSGPRMPNPKSGMEAVAVGHRIYVFGGHYSRASAAGVLDTKAGAWSDIPPIPDCRGWVSVAAVDERFIWLFSNSSLHPQGLTNVFDIVANSWMSAGYVANQPMVVGGMAAVGHTLHATSNGGRTVEIFDTDSLTWTRATPAPFPVQGIVGYWK